MTVPLADRPTALYRLFDADDRLLYVGIAWNPPSRWVTHAAQKAWWPDVARTTITWYDNRAEAEDAEVLAIDTEKPLYNVLHYPGHSPEPVAVNPAMALVPQQRPTERVITPEMDRTMKRLQAAAAVVVQHEADRQELADAIVFAFECGIRPSEVDAEVPYDRNHVRRIAKKAGVPPLRESTVKPRHDAT